MLLGCRTAVYTWVSVSVSTEGGNLRCFSSISPVFGLLCRMIRCTCALDKMTQRQAFASKATHAPRSDRYAALSPHCAVRIVGMLSRSRKNQAVVASCCHA